MATFCGIRWAGFRYKLSESLHGYIEPFSRIHAVENHEWTRINTNKVIPGAVLRSGRSEPIQNPKFHHPPTNQIPSSKSQPPRILRAPLLRLWDLGSVVWFLSGCWMLELEDFKSR